MYWKSAQMNFYKKSGVGYGLVENLRMRGYAPACSIIDKARETIKPLKLPLDRMLQWTLVARSCKQAEKIAHLLRGEVNRSGNVPKEW